MKKGWTTMDVLFSIGAVLVMLVFVCSLVSFVRGCSEAVDEIQRHGLKSVVERVWEGERKQDGN